MTATLRSSSITRPTVTRRYLSCIVSLTCTLLAIYLNSIVRRGRASGCNYTRTESKMTIRSWNCRLALRTRWHATAEERRIAGDGMTMGSALRIPCLMMKLWSRIRVRWQRLNTNYQLTYSTNLGLLSVVKLLELMTAHSYCCKTLVSWLPGVVTKRDNLGWVTTLMFTLPQNLTFSINRDSG